MRPKVARAPKRSPRVTTKPQGSPTPAEPSTSSLTDHSPPESISGDEDSNGEEDITYNTDSLTSHTTASSSTSADILSTEASNSIPHMSDSVTESKFSTVMPYMKDSGQTSDSVFIETSSPIDSHVSQLHTSILLKLILLLHPVLLIQHLNKLLLQGEVLEAQGEHPLYVLGKPLPIVLG